MTVDEDADRRAEVHALADSFLDAAAGEQAGVVLAALALTYARVLVLAQCTDDEVAVSVHVFSVNVRHVVSSQRVVN